jgi:hypothetical protein
MPMVLNVWPAVPDRLRTRGVNYINGYCLQCLLAETLNDGLLEINLTLMKSTHSKKMFSNRIFNFQLRCTLITYLKGKKGAQFKGFPFLREIQRQNFPFWDLLRYVSNRRQPWQTFSEIAFT